MIPKSGTRWESPKLRCAERNRSPVFRSLTLCTRQPMITSPTCLIWANLSGHPSVAQRVDERRRFDTATTLFSKRQMPLSNGQTNFFAIVCCEVCPSSFLPLLELPPDWSDFSLETPAFCASPHPQHVNRELGSHLLIDLAQEEEPPSWRWRGGGVDKHLAGKMVRQQRELPSHADSSRGSACECVPESFSNVAKNVDEAGVVFARIFLFIESFWSFAGFGGSSLWRYRRSYNFVRFRVIC